MIHPRLLCGIVIWGFTFKTYEGKLSVLQNKTSRIAAEGKWLKIRTMPLNVTQN